MKPEPVEIDPETGVFIITEDSAALWMDECPGGVKTLIGRDGRCLISNKTPEEVCANEAPWSSWEIIRLGDADVWMAKRLARRQGFALAEENSTSWNKAMGGRWVENYQKRPEWEAFRSNYYLSNHLAYHYMRIGDRYFCAARESNDWDYSRLRKEIRLTFGI